MFIVLQLFAYLAALHSSPHTLTGGYRRLTSPNNPILLDPGVDAAALMVRRTGGARDFLHEDEEFEDGAVGEGRSRPGDSDDVSDGVSSAAACDGGSTLEEKDVAANDGVDTAREAPVTRTAASASAPAENEDDMPVGEPAEAVAGSLRDLVRRLRQ
jgi:hypothetical protein